MKKETCATNPNCEELQILQDPHYQLARTIAQLALQENLAQGQITRPEYEKALTKLEMELTWD